MRGRYDAWRMARRGAGEVVREIAEERTVGMSLRRAGGAGVALLLLCGCGGVPAGKEKAMTTIDTAAAVRREGGKVWIEGVKGFDAGEYASSVHGAQARILQALGEDLTYDDLICYAGFAFRIGCHEQMCPSAGHPCCGYMCVKGSVRAMPRKLKLFEAGPWVKPKADRAAFEAEARAAVKASIDRGVPVQYGSEEDGLIVGYADEGRRWLCLHPYHKDPAERFRHDEASGFAGGKWPWGIAIWDEPRPPGERPSDRELTVAALRQAVDMWKTEKRDKYFCGEAAYRHWLGWLGDVEAGRAADPKAGMQGNGWCFDVLVHSRRIAGRWLKAKAAGFDGEAGRQTALAAGHYTAIAEGCMKGLDCPWDLAPPPGKAGQWTGQMRQEQVRRLRAARDHDAAAITALEKALAAMDGR